MKKKKILLVLIFFIFNFLLTNSYPNDFEYVMLFSVQNVFDPIAFPGLQPQPSIQANGWTESNLNPVYVQFNNTNPVDYVQGGQNYAMTYLPQWSNFYSMSLYNKVFPFPSSSLVGQNAVFFIDINTNGTRDIEEPLNYILPRQQGTYNLLPAVQNVQITGGIYPTITWNNVTNAENYRVGIVGFLANGNPNQADLKFITMEFLTSTSYTYSGSPLQYGQSYAFFVEARDYLGDDPSDPFGNLVNMSRYYTEYTPAVPEPATMLLLGSGLIGLAGYGRRKLFKK